MATATSERLNTKVVPGKDWLAARKTFLAKEKEFTRLRDEISRLRRELPWEKVTKNYVFEGPKGKVTLADLFEGRSQLIVYHFMFGRGWKEGCPSCSFLADTFDGAALHLAQRDVSFTAVSRATLAEIEGFKRRMGWKFSWVSSNGSDFNYDYRVSFTPEEKASGAPIYNYGTMVFPSDEGPGLSVFYKDPDGQIYHTYSTYGRGLDIFLTAYNFLDHTPKGRDEEGMVPHAMAWVRHHDRYNGSEVVTIAEAKQAPRVLDPVLAELRAEAATTRRVLERVPSDKLTWKPHERSLTLGQLANHIAMIQGRLAAIVPEDGFDVLQGQFVPPQPKDVQEVLATFEQSVRDAEACLTAMSDEAALGNWTLKRGDHEIFTKPRIGVIRMIMMSHVFHHRGQLSVYLRMLNVPVPSIYGPSADDNPFM